MLISISTSGLKRTKLYEYFIRFVLGGVVTVIAGLLSKEISPTFGGLFLAFPAILAASTTLVEKHEREKKEEKGLHGLSRGRHAAGADAAGAAMGSIGLIVFALVVWKFVQHYRAPVVITCATLLWAVVSLAIWWRWKRLRIHHLRRSLRRLRR